MRNKMTGSLQVKSGTYYAVLRIPDETGREKQKWISTGIKAAGNNKRLANHKLRELIFGYDQQKITYTKEISFIDWLKIWMEQKRNEIRTNTHESYSLYLKVHILPFFIPLKLTLSTLTPQHIQDYYNKKRKENQSAGSIRKHNAILRGALQEALKKNLIPYNPADRATLPSRERFVGKAYTVEQANKLLSVIDNDPMKPAIILSLLYGLRRSEVLGLRWKDLDFGANTLTIRNTVVKVLTVIEHEKTKSRASNRTLEIIPETREYLQSLKAKQEKNRALLGNAYDDNGHVCVWDDGKAFRPDYLSQHFALILKRNELPHLRYHDLRHTTGSLLMNRGLSAKQIQEYLGHENVSTTLQIYGHLDAEAKKEAAYTIGGMLKIGTE
jgi:integrase